MSRIAYWFAAAWTLGVTVFYIVMPIYGARMSWMETTRSGEQVRITEPGSQTLIDVNGMRVLYVLAIPLLIVALPLLMRTPVARRRTGLICGSLLAVFAFISSWTIGSLYFPAALALLISAAAIRPGETSSWKPHRAGF